MSGLHRPVTSALTHPDSRGWPVSEASSEVLPLQVGAGFRKKWQSGEKDSHTAAEE